MPHYDWGRIAQLFYVVQQAAGHPHLKHLKNAAMSELEAVQPHDPSPAGDEPHAPAEAPEARPLGPHNDLAGPGQDPELEPDTQITIMERRV